MSHNTATAKRSRKRAGTPTDALTQRLLFILREHCILLMSPKKHLEMDDLSLMQVEVIHKTLEMSYQFGLAMRPCQPELADAEFERLMDEARIGLYKFYNHEYPREDQCAQGIGPTPDSHPCALRFSALNSIAQRHLAIETLVKQVVHTSNIGYFEVRQLLVGMRAAYKLAIAAC